jgi:hypothetical protein
MSALSKQISGEHYRRFNIQPVEFIFANGIGFLAGNIIKYATRYTYKGGAADIRKIIHYCELILEFEYGVGKSGGAPEQPPIDNKFVAPGCEQFSEESMAELAKPEHQYRPGEIIIKSPESLV